MSMDNPVDIYRHSVDNGNTETPTVPVRDMLMSAGLQTLGHAAGLNSPNPGNPSFNSRETPGDLRESPEKVGLVKRPASRLRRGESLLKVCPVPRVNTIQYARHHAPHLSQPAHATPLHVPHALFKHGSKSGF